jgi:hypothetical protein
VGHRHYRLTVDGSATIGEVGFWLTGSATYRNTDRIVHLYNYLLDGARRARAQSTAPALSAAAARLDEGLVGPFRIKATSAAALASDAAEVVNEGGVEFTEPLEPGTVFYLRPRRDATTSATVTMTVPGSDSGHGGRVLTGVARDAGSRRYTPVALAVPTQLVVDFDIDW